MTFCVTESVVRTLRPGDPGFTLRDGLVTVSRAGMEISELCPTSVRLAIERAVCDGYLKPIAHIYENEHTFNLLKGN